MIRIAHIRGEGPSYAAFLDLPDALYRQDAHWQARTKARTRRLLDRQLNPYWRQAEYALFLAWRGTRPVGRISATRRILAGSRAAGETDGFCGFFESIPDPEVAGGLLDAAADWLRERGCARMLGPCQPTPDFDRLGLLVEGFDAPRVSGEAFNPEYYPALFAARGLRKERDFFSFQNSILDNPVFDRAMARLERYLERHSRARVRVFDVAHFERDTAIVRDILTRPYADHPLYAPLDQDTYAFLLHTITRREDMNWFMIVELDGQPAGVNLLVPNADARPRGEPIHGIGTCEFSILPEYQRTDAAAALFHASWARARRHGYAWASMAYQEERHVSMHRMLEKVGSVRTKRFRLHALPLTAECPSPAPIQPVPR